MDLVLTRDGVVIMLTILLVIGLLLHVRDVRRFKTQIDISGLSLLAMYVVPYMVTSGFAISTLFNIFHTDLLRGLFGGYVALLLYIFISVGILKSSSPGTERYKHRYETVYWGHIFGIILVLVGIVASIHQLNFL